ncbi:putative acetyltransferase [Prosthecobacter debontii]|uniref:Putative acetyltransferase n=1 Tax=Prosthecobacter debontii TaxID=48467 RepID=A0A1T4YAJ1_9BACT|nr:GNAT family N-acetyltransferase [Prosthecobacter debontii]SKA98548.1 putative acetyltransferase [Prosthecobacter debontii]
MNIKIDDLSDPEIAAFLEEHIQDMRSVSPPESKHALDLNGLWKPEIAFWTAWNDVGLVGCCALKTISKHEGEVKSMRVSKLYRGRGLGQTLCRHLISEAQKRGLDTLFLETGSMDFFIPARKLYERIGFVYCGPFSGYRLDPNSVFMTRKI